MARPALQLAHPSGAVAESYRRISHQAVSVYMTHGTWRMLDAIGWIRDTSGRWRICVLWYSDQPEQSQREDWFMYDPGRVHLVPEG
jgi:hypothetical protein